MGMGLGKGKLMEGGFYTLKYTLSIIGPICGDWSMKYNMNSLIWALNIDSHSYMGMGFTNFMEGGY